MPKAAQPADAGSEALSIDDVVGQLDAADTDTPDADLDRDEQDRDEPEAAVEEDAGTDDDAPEDGDEGEAEDSEAETAEDDGDGEDAEEDEGEPEAAAVEAPHWWSADKKALFAKAPPEIQAAVAEQEKLREAAVTKAQQDAAEARKKAETDSSQMQQYVAALNEILPKAQQTFASKWDRIDWKAWADTDPEAAMRGRIQMEEEGKELQRLNVAKQFADQQQRATFVAQEEEKLKTLAPELAHPETGKALRTEVGKFLMEKGATPDELANIDARILSIAYDAYRYRHAQAKAQAQAKAKPAAQQRKQKTPVITPSSAPPLRSHKQATIDKLQARFDQNPSLENAVALQNAMEP